MGTVSIELTATVCRTMSKFIQQQEMPESGGILLGKYEPSKRQYTITEVTTPNKYDRYGYTFFCRSLFPAQKIIDMRWHESNGIINYLGEWHTHGCDKAFPSDTDKKLLRTVIADHSNVWPEALMIILGRSSCYICITNETNNGEILAFQYIDGEKYAFLFHR